MMLPPVLDGRGRPLDQIRIVGLTAVGHHGVFEHERRDGQDFAVDVILHLDTRPAAVSDDLDDTVDYGSLSVDLADAVRGKPVNLIEKLAGRLALMCLADPRVAAADVVLHKPRAPIPEAFADVMVVVRRSRADLEDAATTAVVEQQPVLVPAPFVSLPPNMSQAPDLPQASLLPSAPPPSGPPTSAPPPVAPPPAGMPVPGTPPVRPSLSWMEEGPAR